MPYVLVRWVIVNDWALQNPISAQLAVVIQLDLLELEALRCYRPHVTQVAECERKPHPARPRLAEGHSWLLSALDGLCPLRWGRGHVALALARFSALDSRQNRLLLLLDARLLHSAQCPRPDSDSVAQTLQTGHAIGTVQPVPLDELVALLAPKRASVGATVAGLRARCAAVPACLHRGVEKGEKGQNGW